MSSFPHSTRPLGRCFALAAVAAIALASTPLKAEEPGWFGGLKVRAGYRLAAQKDGLSGSLMGLGLETGLRTPQGVFSAELGMLYLPGSETVLDLAKGDRPAGVTVAPEASLDSRKNQIQGLTLRLAYEKPFQDFGLRCGLQVGSLQFRQEYVGDVTGTSAGKAYEDTYNGVNSKGSLSVSPFVGVAFPIGRDQRLELQVLALRYKACEYVHVPGTVANMAGGHTSLDSFQDAGRTVPHLEIAYSLHF